MQLFISHAHVDRTSFVDTWLVPPLTAAGHTVWIDDHLTGGRQWQSELELEIRKSDAVVYVLTPDSINSKVCRWEIAMALKFAIPVVPVLCQKTKIPRWLASLQYVDFTGGPSAASNTKLLEAVTRARGQAHPTMPPRFSRKELMLASIGIILLLASMVGLGLALTNGDGDNRETNRNEAAPTTEAVPPSDTPSPSATPSPTESPTETSTATSTATATLTATSTATATTALTEPPTAEMVFSGEMPPPSTTPSPTHTASPSASVSPLPTTQTGTYPCEATIVAAPGDRNTALEVVHAQPYEDSFLLDPVRVNQKVQITQKSESATDGTWYRIADASGAGLGWVKPENVQLSAACSQ